MSKQSMGRAIAWIGITAIVVMVIAAEIVLRRWFGFGNPLLYVADERIGYVLAPNQEVRRFGNRILINHYSMRGEAIAQKRPPQTLRLLLLGDSIANGGWWTAQTDTISALLQQQLTSSIHATTTSNTVEVLNASANSWGPRNELAYLQIYGCFESQALILLLNTDDLFATTPTSVQVGRDRNYPAQRPPFAIAELIGRYMLPPVAIPELEAVRAEGGDRVGKNLEAIRQIHTYITQQGGTMIVVLTPLLRELVGPVSREYEIKARDRLTTFTQNHRIAYLDMLPLLNAHDNPKELYRDHIHFNFQGNQFITQQVIVHWLDSAIATLH
ncbi:MAG: SGNH/GDSL hydrolase family protein [Cyanobacteria bacterium J06633_2]